MEYWFDEYSNVKHNFSGSGIPDFELDIKKKKIQLGYNKTTGSESLINKIMSLYKTPDNSLDEMIITTGSSEAFYLISNVIFSQNDEVIVLSPFFQLLSEVPKSLGVKVVEIPIYDNSFSMDLIIKSINKKTKAIIINSPHNPTGNEIEIKYLDVLIQHIKNTGIYLILDEVYAECSINGEYLYSKIINKYEKVVSIGSMSKAYGAPGLRVGWAISKEVNLIKKIRILKDYTSYSSSIFTHEIAEHILTDYSHLPRYWSNISKNNYEKLKDETKNNLNFNVKSIHSFICFPKLKKQMDSIKLAHDLVRKKEIFILPGVSFNRNEHIRINLARDPNHFDNFILLLKEYFYEISRN